MEKLIQPVVEQFPKYAIEKQVSPSYVEMHTRNKRDIALVYLKTKQTSTNANNDITGKKKEVEELDLTGSPLKLDLSLHTILDDTIINDEPQLWNREEGLHCPVDIEKAREIADLYNRKLAQVSQEESLPMWLVCNPTSKGKPLLLTVQSDSEHFARGIVSYIGTSALDDIDVEELVKSYALEENVDEKLVSTSVDCKYLISGISYSSHNTDELLNAPHGGVTQLKCEWSSQTLHTPYISCKVHLEQEVIIGHLASPCNAIWKSVCSIHNINQLLVDMTAAGVASVNLESAVIRNPTASKPNNSKRLKELLNRTETYAYLSEGTDDAAREEPTSIQQCCKEMSSGSGQDFTYMLWDVLRDCENAEELITLLLQALKFISSGKIRPFIDPNNKTYLSKLVLKLSRGHSQAAKVLKSLRSSAPQALSLAAQVGIEKTMLEYTRVISLLEHSFYVAPLWNTDAKTQESIEQINQTINDMTIVGDYTLNPFESLSNTENSIRLECETFYDEDAHELTVDDFASLKKHGLVAEKKDINEVPLIADEIDISPWKNLLMKFAQVHVCLEHLYRAEVSLRADFAGLKPIASRLLEHYVSDRSAVRTVGQLLSDPVQKICLPIANNIVQDQLKKPALWYRVELSRKEGANLVRESRVLYTFSQLPVFPPPVWQHIEPATEDVGEVTAIGEDLKYHCTKYIFISNKMKSTLTL